MSTAAQRAELHRTIWQITNELRGSVDGWDFKAYVLGFLFYRYLSDAEAEAVREETVREKGFFIRPSELFDNVREWVPR